MNGMVYATGFTNSSDLPVTSNALQKTLNRPDVHDKLLSMGAEPTPSNPTDFAALVKRQLEVWGQKVKDAGIQPE